MEIQMMLFILMITIGSVTCTNLSNIRQQCPEQSISDHSQTCITPDYIEGCIRYKTSTECFQCADEYELIHGRCDILIGITPKNHIVGCLQVLPNGKCNNCANGFIRQEGNCKVGVKNCEVYFSDGGCQRCKAQFSLMFNECRHNNLLGCKEEKQGSSCSECFKPFELTDQKCLIPHCKKYNDFGCVACQCGFYLSGSRSCLKMNEGCLQYSRGVCVQCFSHFKLMGGVCVIDGCIDYQGQNCYKCSDSYELINGGCTFRDCLQWQSDRCLICKSGFNLIQGKCKRNEEAFACSGQKL